MTKEEIITVIDTYNARKHEEEKKIIREIEEKSGLKFEPFLVERPSKKFLTQKLITYISLLLLQASIIFLFLNIIVADTRTLETFISLIGLSFVLPSICQSANCIGITTLELVKEQNNGRV